MGRYYGQIAFFSLLCHFFHLRLLGSANTHLVPAITYGGVSLGANIAYYFLARELVNSDTAHKKAIKELLGNYKKSYLTISLNIIGIVLGYLVTPLAVLITNGIMLFGWLMPSKKIESHYVD